MRELGAPAGSAVIAVTGATGTVGRHVVDGLARSRHPGVAVRALSRRGGPASEATTRADPAVTWARFSFTDPATWAGAFTGVEALFVVRPPQLVRVTRDLLPALDAARELGVRRAVLLSVLGAEKNPLLPHRRIERWLETSGMAATTLRAGNFMQNLVDVHAPDVRDRDRLVLPAGAAAMSYVDARDVADVATRCLLGEAPTRGAWDLTGPAAITHDDVADALAKALGRHVRYTHPSLPRYWAHARRTGMPPGLIAATSVLYTLARAGIGGRTSADVATVLGRPARDITAFALEHRAAWQRPSGGEEPDS